MARRDKTVTYRLGKPYIDRLTACAESAGMSPGQYARLLLVMHFEETASHRMADALEKLAVEVTELRIEHALQRRR